MTQSLIPNPKDPVALGIEKKRQELVAMRREAQKQIKAIDRSIALLGQAVQVFDPSTILHLQANNLKPKRFPKTKRFVLNIMREAAKPLTSREIADAWMVSERVEDTDANRRLYRGRIGSCLQNCRTKGVVEVVGLADDRENGPQKLWRIKAKS